MFEIKKNEKNKSAVILNPERSEWVSRSHVTSVEPVVNDRVKTKRYSVKRDLYGPSLRSTLKMTAFAFLLSLNLSTAFADSCKSGEKVCGTGCIAESMECKSCGGSCYYTQTTDGAVTLYGSGEVASYSLYEWKKVDNVWGYYSGDTADTKHPFYKNSSITSVSLDSSSNFTSIGHDAFAGATGLTSITIPDSVTSIGNYAFSDASSLESITIPEGVTSIGNGAFMDAKSLTSITIPEGVTSIGSQAFSGASSLTSITIPEGVTSIGEYAFYGATGLTSITIPEGVTSIGSGTFSHATGLTSITIPEGVTSIGSGAFADASSLTSITIPEGVTSIGEYVFYHATSLTSITIPDNINTEGWNSSAFAGLPASTNIVCQGGLNTCYEKLAKYFTSATCPQSLKDAGKGNLCNCDYSDYCISPSRISEATSASQCTGNYGWSGAGCSRKNADGSVDCASGFVEWENQCLSEYPFAKKRWTPAEASKWLHDGNDNFVVITFKK